MEVNMARPAAYQDEDLMILLYEINKRYGYVSVETMQMAHEDDPYRYPSYKMFERRFGGVRKMVTKEFIKNLEAYADKKLEE
jgi:hypothetical protein